MAVVQAEVETEKGAFMGIGDANPSNVNRMILPHLLRMAETRAKARALRDAVNIGVTALEELGDLDDAGDETAAEPATVRQRSESYRADPPKASPYKQA